MQLYVCVICKDNTAPLSVLSLGHRRIFETIVSPAMNIEKLKECRLLSCVYCQRLMQTVVMFQQKAVIGAHNVLRLLPLVQGKPTPVPEPLPVQIKNEPEEEAQLEVKSFIEIEVDKEKVKTQPLTEVTVKIEPDADSSATDTCESDIEDSVKPDTIKKVDSPVLQAQTTVLPGTAKQLVKVAEPPRQLPLTVHSYDRRSATFKHRRPTATTTGCAGGSRTAVTGRGGNVTSNPPLSNLLHKTVELPRLLPKPLPVGIANYTGIAEPADTPNNQKVDGRTPRSRSQCSAAPVRCQHCYAPLKNEASLARHMAKLHAEPPVPVECKDCHKVLESKLHLKRHSYVHKKKETPQPPSSAWYIRVLKDDEVSAERDAERACAAYVTATHRCEPCVAAFGSAAEAEAHARRHLTSAGPYICQICTQRARSMQELSEHSSQHTVRYCCCYCQHTTPDKQTAQLHSCDVRKQRWQKTTFSKHLHLDGRRARYRYPPRPVLCQHCYSRFKDEESLAKHTAKHHAEPPVPVECKVCHKVFQSKFHLQKHSYTHVKKDIEGLKPELFCSECKTWFETPSKYRYHLLTLRHSGRDLWRFECDYCGKKCPSKAGVRIHIQLVHTKERAFKCEKCPKRFISLCKMKKHALCHTPGSRPRPYVCEQCGKSFTIKKSLAEHLDAHAGRRPHACALCPATFTFKAALFTHNRLKHLRKKEEQGEKEDLGEQEDQGEKGEYEERVDESLEEKLWSWVQGPSGSAS